MNSDVFEGKQLKSAWYIEKSGTLGTLFAAVGCAACFPALGSIGVAIGLGFLSRYEGLFINTLLPLFAAIALTSHAYTGISQREWFRLSIGIAGPSMVLATLYLFWTEGWSTWLFYGGLGLMALLALSDLISLCSGKQCACTATCRESGS